ncbi:unnamed protein product [Scytosiphon promiscuus]
MHLLPPTGPPRLSLQRGVALLAAAFAPPSGVHRRTVTMTTPCVGTTCSEKLSGYATTMRGHWILRPAAALDQIVPELGGDKHKGQLGRVGVFGGSEEYTGAPFFASMSALRMGADLTYVFTAKEAAPALKVYSPELMVTPVYSADSLPSDSTGGSADPSRADRGDDKDNANNSRVHTLAGRPIADAVASRLPKLHSLLLGPGMGRHPAVAAAAARVVSRAREASLPVVLDADAIAMVVADPGAVRGFRPAVLTPNANEFRLLCERMEADGYGDDDRGGERETKKKALAGGVGGPVVGARQRAGGEGLPPPPSGTEGAGRGRGGSTAAPASRSSGPRPGPSPDKALQVERLARFLGGVTVVLKGRVDIISDGSRTVACEVPGGLKRCGGIGDVLSGAMATALAWVNLQNFGGEEAEELRLWAVWWACAVTRRASRRAFEAKGRATSATDVFEAVGGVFEEVSPSPTVED